MSMHIQKSKPKRGRPPADPEVRRKQILEGAIELFSAKGYASTDIQQLADHIGIAKGTVYLYFRSKESLFKSAVEHSVESLAEFIDAEVSKVKSPPDKIRKIIDAHFSFFESEEALTSLIARERGDLLPFAEQAYIKVFNKNASRIEAILREGMRRGLFRKINVGETTGVLANLLTGTIYSSVLLKTGGEFSGIKKATTEILLKGILKRENE